jgi:putative ABC transport system permease protein
VGVFRQLHRGLRALVQRRATDREIDDEVQHFLSESARAHEGRGLSRAAAMRAATIEMGNLTFTREFVRGSGWEHGVETFLADVRYALRRLRRSPGFTVTAVATLAVGIGASTAVFSAINPILLEPLPFPHASRLVTLDDRAASGAPMAVTFGTFAEVRARTRSFEALGAADTWQPSISGLGDPERLRGQRITAGFFSVFGVGPAVGRDFTHADEQAGGARIVIVSAALARERFGDDRAIVGRTIDLDGDPYTVVGVMPRGFASVTDPAAQVWSPLRDRVTGDLAGREWGHHYTMIGRLAPTATVESAAREVLAIGRAPLPAYARPAWANLQQGLLVRSMQDDVTGPVRPTLYAIAGAVLRLLVVASVNVTNLFLARGAQRRVELAMRVALGAGRRRIVRQLLTESVVLALLGGIGGLAVAQLGVRALVAASPPGLPRVEAIHASVRVFAFALVLTAAVGILVGLVPSLGAVRGESNAGLHRAARANARGHALTRSVLVVSEVALAVVLLVGAGLLYRSVARLMLVPPGFDPSHVVTMQVVEAGHAFDSDPARLQFYEQALTAVRHLPGVASAGWTSQLPLSGDVDGYGYEAQSVPASSNGGVGSALRYAVTPGYFDAMRIPLRRGRLIDAGDRAGAPEAIVINESMAKNLFGNRDPIGERIRFGPEMSGSGAWDYVVGVVGDVKHYSLSADAPDAFYVASAQWGWVDNVQTLVVRATGDAAALVPSIERAVWSIDRNQPIQRVRTMDAFVTASAGQRRFAMLVLQSFAAAAFLLAAVGLYGVIAGGVVERVREIGIRSALGATPADIVADVVRPALLLAASGSILGIAASLAATRLIRNMLFGVSSIDVLTYLSVLMLLLGTAALAAWAPARRAAGIDPVRALRAE